MRLLVSLILVLASHLDHAVAAVADTNSVAGTFVVLAYHEVRDEVRDYPDPYAVDSAALVRQFSWLRGNGYSPVSLDEILVARQGGKPLPEKAVLLTFDDAYLSFYTRVYPLLREFGFPAVLAVVGRWIDNSEGTSILYGEKESIPDARFPSWSQLIEMENSGLVEIASHTYDLHHGIPANPQGNLQAAATTRTYDAKSDSYEGDSAWQARIRVDLARNSEVIERNTGHRPRAIVWPYGRYNDELVRMASDSGLSIALTLDDGANTPDVPLTAIRRTLIDHNPTLAEFVVELQGPRYPEPMRIVQVNLDAVYSADPAQQEHNLSALLDRIERLKPTHIFLQATTDTNGNGVAEAAYFPNRHLRLRGDLFNRVSWQISSRVGAKVFAVMPIGGYRLSPVNITEVYEDLARHASFDGVVFDDTLWSGVQDDVGTLEFTRQLTRRVRAFRAPLKTVRTLTIEASPATRADELQDTKNVKSFAAAYDYVVLVAKPPSQQSMRSNMERAALDERLQRAISDPDIRRKAVFMFRTNSQTTNRLAPNEIAREMRALQLGGALNFGYVPDDYLHDDPPLEQIAPAMSLRVYPQKLEMKDR